MDLPRYREVLQRHRHVVTFGLALAVVLATLSYARPAWEDWRPVLKYREQEAWTSQARVLLAVPGLPGTKGWRPDAVESAEARLPSLAVLYAGLTTGDDIRNLVKRTGAPAGKAVAAAATAAGGTATLPIVEITTISPTASGSRRLANRYANALMTYVRRQQAAAEVAPQRRVAVQLLNRAGETELIDPRSRTLPIVVFLALISATVGVAFALENWQSRRPPTLTLEPWAYPPEDSVRTHPAPAIELEGELVPEDMGTPASRRRLAQ